MAVKVVLIDDDKMHNQTFANFLTRSGLDVLCAYSAQQGLDIIDDNRDIDAVVLDIFMPQHNGLTVLHYLQSYVDWQKMPIIIMSSVPRKEIELSDRQLKNRGVRAYLEKDRTTPQDVLSILLSCGSAGS